LFFCPAELHKLFPVNEQGQEKAYKAVLAQLLHMKLSSKQGKLFAGLANASIGLAVALFF
jgi:hypothetical protein